MIDPPGSGLGGVEWGSGRVEIESAQPFSDSLLWRLQRSYFEGQGVDAWRTGTVPHYVTSNPAMADAYGRAVLSFIEDCCQGDNPEVDVGEPFYVVEVGAGCGRFAYHFCKRFSEALDASHWRGLRVIYVMTDFAPQTIEYWRRHPRFKPLVDGGHLDFAAFDASEPRPLVLLESGTVLGAGPVRNPLAVVANYVFDGLPQDCFRVRGGRLFEALVSVYCAASDAGSADPAVLERLTLSWTHRPVTAGRYDDPDLDGTLAAWVAGRGDGTFLFPTTALRCVRFFREMAAGPLFVLSADMAAGPSPAEPYHDPPSPAFHGSFSLPVDYEVIAEYARSQGATVLHPSHDPNHLTVAGYLFGEPPGEWRSTRHAYRQAVDEGGPDDLYALKGAVAAHAECLTLDQLLAFVRVSGWDGHIVADLLPVLLARAREATDPQRRDLVSTAENVWDTYYPMGEPRDVPFGLGALLYAAGQYREAIPYLERSEALWGPDPAAVYLRACCHRRLGELGVAAAGVHEALKSDPRFEPAVSLKAAIDHELAGEAAGAGPGSIPAK
jgi:hypothetical protein